MTTPTTVQVRFQFRADTAANWTTIDPVLLANELGRETDTGKIKIGDGTTAWSSLGYQALGRISDADIATDAEIAVSKLANGTANQILTTDGTDVSWTDNPTIAGNVIISGNLTVNGTETIINVDTLQVEDKTIEMGNVTTPTDLTADGGGIVLKGATDKTITWSDTTDAWTSSERFDFPAGTAVAPSIILNGDVNSGIYQPGADQVAISTGGTERLRITSDGKVGIGTSSVASLLHLASSNPVLTLQRSDSASPGAAIHFTNNTAGVNWQIGTNQAVGGSAFEINAGNQVNNRFVITSDGKVGIGTSAVDEKLHIEGAGTQALKLVNTTTGSYASPQLLQIKFEGSGTREKVRLETTDFSANSVGSELRIYTRNTSDVLTQALVVDQSQRVGIGTTSPGYALDVQSTGAARLSVVSTNNNAAGAGIYMTTLNGGTLVSNATLRTDNAGNFSIFSGTSSDSERLRIDSSGRLLVGTSTSRSNWYNGSGRDPLLQIEQSGNTRLGITRTDNNNNGPELLFGKTRDSSYAIVSNGDEIGEISFQGADGTELVEAVSIKAQIDGTPGANDMPGRIVLATTASGASTPTERLRITSDGAFGLSGANYGTSGQVLTSNGSSAAPTWQNAGAGAGLFTSYAILAHVEPDGTDGGSSVADTWTTRTINTEVADPDGIVTLSSNQFTLGAGSYLIEWACVAQATSVATSRLYDSTNTAAIQNSLVLQTSTTYAGSATSAGSARVSPTGSTAYEIQMNTNNSNASDGFGLDNPATGAGDEVYLFVKIYKES